MKRNKLIIFYGGSMNGQHRRMKIKNMSRYFYNPIPENNQESAIEITEPYFVKREVYKLIRKRFPKSGFDIYGYQFLQVE